MRKFDDIPIDEAFKNPWLVFDKVRERKIKSISEAEKIAESYRQQKDNKTIVTTNGVFDMLHIGHILFLENAALFGDIFIVGLNSDESIKQYKSPYRPIVPQKERALILSSLECVDYVTIFNEPNPIHFIRTVKPDFHVKGTDSYRGIEGEVVRENGKLILLDNTRVTSTTALIKRAYELYLKELKQK